MQPLEQDHPRGNYYFKQGIDFQHFDNYCIDIGIVANPHVLGPVKLMSQILHIHVTSTMSHCPTTRQFRGARAAELPTHVPTKPRGQPTVLSPTALQQLPSAAAQKKAGAAPAMH